MIVCACTEGRALRLAGGREGEGRGLREEEGEGGGSREQEGEGGRGGEKRVGGRGRGGEASMHV